MSNRRSTRQLVIGIVVLAVILSLAAYAQLGGAAGVVLPYTGHLEIAGAPAEGDLQLRVTLWDAPSEGNACPAQVETTTTARAGAFHVELGPLPEACVVGRPVYLAVEVDAGDGFVALAGRQRIYPALSAYTSGGGDFVVEGALRAGDATLTGDLEARSATLTDRLHIASTTDASLADDDAPLVVGSTSALNVALDGNGVMARSSGSASALYLNAEGGDVIVGHDTSTVKVEGDLEVAGALRKSDGAPGLVCRRVDSANSGTGDDATVAATCDSNEMLTGCSCFSAWGNCDGSYPSTTNPRSCIAQNGNSGDRSRAVAICCKLQ